MSGGFFGGMTAEKYSQITGTSKATATRDLAELLRSSSLHQFWLANSISLRMLAQSKALYF